MLAVHATTLQVIDLGIQIAGGAAALLFVVQLLLSGRWRNPLAGVRGTGAGPTAVHVCGVLLLFLALLVLVQSTLTAGMNPESLRDPGSHGWYLGLSAEAVARVAVCVAMIYLLRRYPLFGAAADDVPRVWRVVSVGLCGALIVTPLCTLQLQMGQMVWHWLDPLAVPPIHVVLVALSDNTWGHGGLALLWVQAVVIAALSEELFFRGLLLQAVWRYAGHVWLAITITAAVFAVVHQSQPQDVLPMFTLGVALGYVRVRYRSLPACVILHAAFNARTMLIATLVPEMVSRS